MPIPQNLVPTQRLILMGCGAVARRHLKAVKKLQAQIKLLALVDPRPEAAQKLLQQSKLPPQALDPNFRICHSLQEALALFAETQAPSYANPTESRQIPETGASVAFSPLSSSPQKHLAARPLVALTSPASTHAVLAIEALEAACHLLIEKPLALSLADCHRIQALVKQQGVKVALGHIYRYLPFVQHVRRDREQGVSGPLLTASVKLHWGHDQRYYDISPWRGSWLHEGGVLMNQSIHALDLMHALSGETFSSASAQIRRLSHRMEAEDNAVAWLSFSSGALCTLEASTSSSPERHAVSFDLLCQERHYHAALVKGRPRFSVHDRQGKSLTWHYLWPIFREVLTDRKAWSRFLNPHQGIYEDLLAAISTDSPILADLDSGLTSVEDILALYTSARNGGKPVALPLAPETALNQMVDFFN